MNEGSVPVRPLRIGVAALWHETNVFAARETSLADFRNRWYSADELRLAFDGTRTVLGGALDAAADLGVEVVPLVGAFATPGGLVDPGVIDDWCAEVEQAAAAVPPVHAVLLELHGALVVGAEGDAEVRAVDVVRRTVGDVPVGLVLDLHANLAVDRFPAVDVLVGYKTNPHVDTGETGARGMRLLVERVVSGRPFRRGHAGADVVVPPIAQGDAAVTPDGPMARLLAAAAGCEGRDGVVDVSVHGGYAFTDEALRGLGVSVTLRPDSGEDAQGLAAALAARAVREFADWEPQLVDVDELDDLIGTSPGGALVGLADTGDNINGGADGSSRALLGRLAGRGARVLTTLWDPVLLETVIAAGVGKSIGVMLPGASEVLATVERCGIGEFVNTGPMATGARVSMGRTAVLRGEWFTIVLQERATQPNDPELFRSQGVRPEDYDVVILKGAAALRAGWSGLCRIVDIATSGATDSDLGRLYRTQCSTRQNKLVR
jgi:microcystin degradation protein MlrC